MKNKTFNVYYANVYYVWFGSTRIGKCATFNDAVACAEDCKNYLKKDGYIRMDSIYITNKDGKKLYVDDCDEHPIMMLLTLIIDCVVLYMALEYIKHCF